MFAFTSNVPASAVTDTVTRDTFRLPKFFREQSRQVSTAKDVSERAEVTVPNLAAATGFMAWRS